MEDEDVQPFTTFLYVMYQLLYCTVNWQNQLLSGFWAPLLQFDSLICRVPAVAVIVIPHLSRVVIVSPIHRCSENQMNLVDLHLIDPTF